MRSIVLYEQVNYRKQIARQHLCHRNFWPGQGEWSTFLSSSLITVQNLVAMCHTVLA